jgi:hypothetical protein
MNVSDAARVMRTSDDPAERSEAARIVGQQRK